MNRKRLGAFCALVGAMALCVPLASAAELTREEYVAKVEPVCKTNTQANARIFKGAKNEVRNGELTKASKRFKRGVVAFDRTIRQIEAVPPPAADKAKLGKWIDYLKVESEFLDRIGAALAAGDKYQAQNLSVRLNRNSNLANNTVLAFGFNYCRINPSRFS